MSEESWLPVGLAGVLSLCCLTLATLGGAAVTGGVVGATSVTPGLRSIGGAAVTALATIIPLVGVGAYLHWRDNP